MRNVSAVSIARSEHLGYPPHRREGRAPHAKIASGDNQIVKLPRSTSERSYSGQFDTRYSVLYLGWTRDRWLGMATTRIDSLYGRLRDSRTNAPTRRDDPPCLDHGFHVRGAQ